MSARRGWCPSLHEPMPTGDGLLLRVKPRGGLLSARAARRLAGAALSFGNGAIELTGRGALQIRGLSETTAPQFAAEMVAAGLASPDPAAERRRSVVASPLAGSDPASHPATSAVTTALERALEDDAGLEPLPSKFGFSVDGGGALPLGAASADIAIRLLADQAELSIDGGETVAEMAIGDAVPAALALSHAYVKLAGMETRRMRGLVADRGEAAVFASANLESRVGAVPPSLSPAVGVHGDAVGAGLAFGSTTAPILATLADLAERYGDGALRLSPWRTVLIGGVGAVAPLLDALGELDLIVDPGDPLLRIHACPGQPGCASSSVATRTLAARLRPPPGGTLHVSGCDKGCAHPGPASITLVGRAGTFDLVRDGTARGTPERRGLTEAELSP